MKPATFGAITVTSPPTYASSVLSMKRPTVHHWWPYHAAPSPIRSARPKNPTRLRSKRRIALRRSRLTGLDAPRASAELTSGSTTVLLITRRLDFFKSIYTHIGAYALLSTSTGLAATPCG